MNGIKLRGTGRCVPANTVTNDDLSRRDPLNGGARKKV